MFVLFLIGLIHVAFYQALFGLLVSWIYIRFYKVQDGIRGDRSETFAFASFFPQVLQ
jgi:membrane associated rhomboid family serine protease